MTNNQKELSLKIIGFLKKRGLSNREEIAKHIGEVYHNSKFINIIETLVDLNLIRPIKSNVYKLTPEGERFESFEKLEEENSLQIRLAKSNLEANEFQKQMAIKNEIKEKSNRRLMRISIAVGILSIISIVTQVVIAILQAE